MDVPTFDDARDTVSDASDTVRDAGRTLIPWLSDPPQCPDCGTLQKASVTYDPRQAHRVTSWYCGACDVHRRRDPEYGDAYVDGPRESQAADLKEALNDRS